MLVKQKRNEKHEGISLCAAKIKKIGTIERKEEGVKFWTKHRKTSDRMTRKIVNVTNRTRKNSIIVWDAEFLSETSLAWII